MEAGLGSIGALELQQSIAEIFDMEVSPTLAFDHPTVSSMALHLATLKSSSERSRSIDLWTAPKSASIRPSSNGLSYIMGVGCRYPGGAFIDTLCSACSAPLDCYHL